MQTLTKILITLVIIYGQAVAQHFNDKIYPDHAFNISPFEKQDILPEKLSELYKSEPGIKEALVDAFKPKTAETDDHRYTYSYNSNAFLSEKLYEALIGGSWVILGRDNFTYDINGLPVSQLYEQYVSGTWRNNNRTTWTYNNNAQVLSEISEVWSFGTWSIFSKTLFTYDGNGNVLTMLFEQYFNNELISGTRETFAYNAEGLVIDRMTEQLQNGVWHNQSHYTWDYHPEMFIVVGQVWQSGLWINSTRATDSLNSSNQVISLTIEWWLDTEWLNHTRNVYTYTNGNLHTNTFQIWWIEEWLNDRLEIHTYESAGNLSGLLIQEWIWGEWINKTRYTANYNSGRILNDVEVIWAGDSWQNRLSHNYEYDTNGNSISGESFLWDHSAWVPYDDNLNIWYNNNSQVISFYEKWVDMTYDFFTDVNDNNTNQYSFALQDNYPNPFNPQTTISYSIPEMTHVLIKIFDITGTEVAILVNEEKPAGRYDFTWNAAGVPSGVYFYRIHAGESSLTKKMILMK